MLLFSLLAKVETKEAVVTQNTSIEELLRELIPINCLFVQDNEAEIIFSETRNETKEFLELQPVSDSAYAGLSASSVENDSDLVDWDDFFTDTIPSIESCTEFLLDDVDLDCVSVFQDSPAEKTLYEINSKQKTSHAASLKKIDVVRHLQLATAAHDNFAQHASSSSQEKDNALLNNTDKSDNCNQFGKTRPQIKKSCFKRKKNSSKKYKKNCSRIWDAKKLIKNKQKEENCVKTQETTSTEASSSLFSTMLFISARTHNVSVFNKKRLSCLERKRIKFELTRKMKIDIEKLIYEKRVAIEAALTCHNTLVYKDNALVSCRNSIRNTTSMHLLVNTLPIGIKLSTSKPKTAITREFVEKNVLITNFTYYYVKNNCLNLLSRIKERDDFFRELYLFYSNQQESFCFSKRGNVSIDSYKKLAKDIKNRTKRLEYVKKFTKNVPCSLKILLNSEIIRHGFLFNLTLYASTLIDIEKLTDSTFFNAITAEIERLYEECMLPLEIDHLKLLYLIFYFKSYRYFDLIFASELANQKYDELIAFYHFKDLLYILYNIKNIGNNVQYVFSKRSDDLPDSLDFYAMVLNRFVKNTLYLVALRKNFKVFVKGTDNSSKVYRYVINNGVKFLNGEVGTADRLNVLLEEVLDCLKKESNED